MNWQRRFSKRVANMRRSAVRELLEVSARPGMISFAGGLPAPELFPIEEIREATDAVLRQHARRALQYGETTGIAELRDWIVSRYSRPGLVLRRENVMIVTGSQQALDLIGKVFLDLGDRVLVESPTYLAMLSAWSPHGVEFVAGSSDSDGMELDALDLAPGSDAKLIYCLPNFQNPQGTTLALHRRRQLATKSRERGMIVVEDDPYGELRYDGGALPHLIELAASTEDKSAQMQNVIHLGTFSKVLAPGLRLGWVIAPPEVIDRLALAKQSADLHTSTFCQHVALQLVVAGVLDRQIPRLRAEYRVRRDAMLRALHDQFSREVSWTRPDGGMFLLVTLPEGLDAGVLLAGAVERKVAFVPGADFHLGGCGRNTLRLNFSNSSPTQIEEGVKRLACAYREMRGKF